MMLVIIDLLYDRQGSDPVYEEWFAGSTMAVDGHQRSVPIRMRPWETRVATHRGREANRRTVGGPGRRDVPFGPEVSWPYGFRQLDPESREVLESAYGSGPVYQQPAMDDYGYGDPGYSDPSYEGPKTPYGNSALPGRISRERPRRTPGHRGTSGEPATGRRAAFPDTRSPRSVIPPRQLIRDPATRRPATRPLAASPSRSRRRPAAAMRSGRSPAPRRPCPTGGPGTGSPRAGGHRAVVPRGAARVPGTVVRQPAAGRPGPRRLEPVAVSRPAAGGHDLRRAALRRPGTG